MTAIQDNELTNQSSKGHEQQPSIDHGLMQGLKSFCIRGAGSKSGMSRTIKLAYIYNNKLKTINDPLLLELAGVDKNGRIGGCGMDMLFHAQYNLFINLHRTHKEAHYQKRMARYNDL